MNTLPLLLALSTLTGCTRVIGAAGSPMASEPCVKDECAPLVREDTSPLKAWTADYSHYSSLDEGNITFQSTFGDADFSSDHLVLSGANAGDPAGMFVFARRRFDVAANSRFKVSFRVEATVDFSKDCETPVILKGGAGDIEPRPLMAPDYMMRTTVTQDPVLAQERMSIGGEILSRCGAAPHDRLTTQTSFEHTVPAKSAADGTLWVYVGFESASPQPIRVALKDVGVTIHPIEELESNDDGIIDLAYHFASDNKDWTVAFADYPAGQETFFELDNGTRPLPAELQKPGNGLYVSGNNHSDDLLMYLSARIGAAQGLKPGRAYRLDYTVDFASNVPQHCQGVGGAEGESVTLKVGGSAIAPQAVADGNGMLRLNWDIGSQTHGGADASAAGHIANDLSCNQDAHGDRPYRMIQRHHAHTHAVKSDPEGNIWLFVGTDSGFEATTSLYFSSIRVKLTPVHQP